MLDQSFSVENFIQIIDYENRKGVFLEGKFFPDIKKVIDNIRKLNNDIKDGRKRLATEEFYVFRDEVILKKQILEKERQVLLIKSLSDISDKLSTGKFKISIKRNDLITNKPVYIIDDKPELFFALKQVKYNFKRLYKVKQANRSLIVSQIKNLLNDKMPKIIIRTDIESFYENIPHDRLLEKLNEENLLSFSSKVVIRQVINEYKRLSGSQKGLPRGIGISAYLAEVYMRSIDNAIVSLPNVSYYSRYVDDIVIIITPENIGMNYSHLNEIRDIIVNASQLPLNNSKTREFNLTSQRFNHEFDYLGYLFKIKAEEKSFDLSVLLPQVKVDKYKARIKNMLDDYKYCSKKNEKEARILLLKRVRFLTGNTRLLNSKKNVLVGVYYMHSLLTSISDFELLDSYLLAEVSSFITDSFLVRKIVKYKFVDGFNKKRFSPFTTLELSKIVKVWK